MERCWIFYRLFTDDSGTVSTALFLEDGVHPNGQGHRDMAVLAVSEIKKHFLMPCVLPQSHGLRDS